MMRRHGISWATVALVLITGCPSIDDPEGGSSSAEGSDGSSTSTSTSGETSTVGSTSGGSEGSSGDVADTSGGMVDTSGGMADPACDCVEGAEDFVEFVCDTEEICEPVELQCAAPFPQDCALEDFVLADPTVLPCIHDALVAGTPGLLRWEAPYYDDPGAAGQRRWLIVQEDRRAITWHESWGAPSYDISDVEVIELRAPEHFEGCMELASPEEQFRCLFDAGESSAEVCIAAHSFEIG